MQRAVLRASHQRMAPGLARRPAEAQARDAPSEEEAHMFVQVIHGPVASADDAMAMLERWMDEVRPDAIGWLGTTAGVTPDGELLALVRFTSAEEAQRNADRPEQGAWWDEMEKSFTGAVTFHDCEDVAQMMDGGRDDAGFVQVLTWPGAGSLGASELADAGTAYLSRHRPDIIGGVVAISGDGTLIEAVYFTSEEDARRAEAAPRSEEAAQAGEEMDRLAEQLGEPTYHDLPTPMLVS
jgi:hypothetical protein